MPLTVSQLTTLREQLGAERCLTDDADCLHYGQDWTRFYEVDCSAVVFPKTTEEVQWLIEFANKENIKLVPSGGRTGLSAGAVATQGELVVSLEKMNRILDFNATEQVVHCQAGVITASLQDYATEQGLFYPVDFASSGSSTIGGNVATNAGGIRVIRYGLTRDHVVGLTVVNGNGELLKLNASLVKNATGYDFRHLVIGSEGTLGIITEVSVKLSKQPAQQSVLVLALESLDSVQPVLQTFNSQLTLSAFEFFSDEALDKVLEHNSSAQPPCETRAPFYALIEVDMGSESAEQTLMDCFEQVMNEGHVIDGVMSASAQQAEQLWSLREGISEAITPYTPYKNDIAVTSSKVAEFLQAIETAVAEHAQTESGHKFDMIWFGHIGDGNLHLNILKPESLNIEEFKELSQTLSTIVYTVVEQFEGSISAEHGVGLLKKAFLKHTRTPAEIDLMKAVKASFDQNNLLNPGKIF